MTMQSHLDPIAASDGIARDYRRYLASLLPLREPSLASALADTIRGSGGIIRGPFLETTPPYAAGASLRELIAEGVLPPAMSRFDSEELPLERPLYRHQEAATRKARSGRSVVVSTGTGSGKTESFLIPILASLADELEGGPLNPGVRAVLLYPMNALANDQVKRLRKVLVSVPEVTFGRYVGDTPSTEADAIARFADQNPGEPHLPNELLSREQMQSTPPHILLTNYAMLEYLLLRPSDMDLFEGEHGGSWRFIVVDEAHVYDGARGSELAMLLRRLKRRVATGRSVQCIATSATVGADTAPQAVTEFASNLFGSTFEWDRGDPARQDLVLAERVPIPAGTWGPLSPGDFARIANADNPAEAVEALLPEGQTFESAAEALRHERAVVTLRSMLRNRVADLGAVARALGSDWTTHDLVPLVDVGARVRDGNGVPVLAARYHLWVRASEGAFTCLAPDQPHVTLARHEECETCGRPTYELAGCVRCGTPYILGLEVPQAKGLPPVLGPRIAASDGRSWVALTDATGEVDEDDDAWGDAATDVKDAVALCVDCGTINIEGAVSCAACGGTALRSARLAASHSSELRGCVACESRSANDVRRLDTGQDASTSVVATSLYQRLPADPGTGGDQPGAGRKLLIFSDSRQGAAFFAPYLETSYQRILQRRLLLKAVTGASAREGGPAFLDDVVSHACDEATAFGLFERRVSRQQKERQIALWLSQELVAIDERQSLEGLQLVRIEVAEPQELSELQVWSTLGLSGQEGVALLTELLRSVRSQGAVRFADTVDPADEGFAPRLGPVYIRQFGADTKLLAWSPAERHNNKRLDFVTRVLGRTSSPVAPREALEGMWRMLTAASDDPILAAETHSKYGAVRRLDYTWLTARPLVEGDVFYECNTCKRSAPTSVTGVCPGYRCDGTLEVREVGPMGEDNNHYRALYRDLAPIPLTVKEHTAQWRSEQAAEIQNDFVRGKINALSCSTTFELGVDVGELQAVLLKNVPPRTANYVQRAGRAGRRTASAALVVTMAQRRSHDLAQFADPVAMISGEVRPPVVPLGNARIDRRHAHSVVFSAFFRWAFDTRGESWRKSGAFFYPEAHELDALELLPVFLGSHRDSLREELADVLPYEVQVELDLVGAGWEQTLLSALDAVKAEIQQEIDYFEGVRKEAFDARKDAVAASFGRVVKTIRERDLLGFLGSRNILPKYGFPSDVVELRTDLSKTAQGNALELSRDLSQAIYEFAPGSQIVAGGLKWTSAGVYRLPSKELVAGWMAICSECGFFEKALKPLDGACPDCGARRKPAEYTVPEFGFVADRTTEKPGLKPPTRVWKGDTFHLGDGRSVGDALVLRHDTRGDLVLRAEAHSRLVAVSTGQGAGFIICDWCGRGWAAGTRGFTKSHKHSWKDQDCTGPLQRRWLAHEYETDVLTISLGQGPSDPARDWSTLYALLEGAAEELGIARDDLDGTIALAKSASRLVLFDTVPGGAGGALRVKEAFPAVLQRALAKVSNCECGLETSCYSCLRGFRNQMRHDVLVRGLAIEELQAFGGHH